jgi:hypothetical protein
LIFRNTPDFESIKYPITASVNVLTYPDPDSGKYLLIFQGADLKKHQSELVTADASASNLKDAIKEFYIDNVGTNIDVNLTMYDVNGTETTNSTNATSYVYYVVLRELITDMSVTSISVVKAST